MSTLAMRILHNGISNSCVELIEICILRTTSMFYLRNNLASRVCAHK
jgi:hypothetical protein